MSPADRDVLTSLPNARPTRRSAKRAGTAATEKPKPAAAKKKAPAAKKQPATAATAKAATPRKATAAARAKAAKPKATASAPRAKKAAAAKPQGTAPSSPPPPPAGWATPKPERPEGGGDLLGTAVQALGELAQIGLAYGGQAVKQALSRLPRP
jgi:hypothetical protein